MRTQAPCMGAGIVRIGWSFVNPPWVLVRSAPLDESIDPDERLLEPFVRRRVARADVLLARGPECAAGNDRDMLFLEQAP